MKTFDLNIFQLLIILGSIQGLVFAFIIFLRKKLRLRSNIFLGLMVVFLALSNIQHILIDMNFLTEDSVIRKLYLPIQWLISPMFYLHVYDIVFKKKINHATKLYLFTPVAFVFVLHIVNFFVNYADLPISEMPDYYAPGLLLYINFVSFVFHGAVLFTVFIMLRKNIALSKNHSGKKIKEQKWYLKVVWVFAAIVTAGLSAALSIIQFNIDPTWLLYTLFLLVSSVGYFLGYIGVYRSTLKNDFKNAANSISKNGANTYQKIDAYIIKEERYLDMDLNLSEIAEKFNISPGYLSQLINKNSDQNFNDYINQLRVNASKKMLLSPQFENYTIESIGLECGFKSKSNFYTSFKKFTGLTPKAYIKDEKMRPVF